MRFEATLFCLSKHTKKEKKQSPNDIQPDYYETPLEEFYKPWEPPQSPWSMNEIRNRVEEHNNLFTNYKNLKVQSKNSGFRGNTVGYNPRKSISFNRHFFYEMFEFLWFYKSVAIFSIILIFTWIGLVYLYWNIHKFEYK